MENMINDINEKIINQRTNLIEKMEQGEMDLTGAVDDTMILVQELLRDMMKTWTEDAEKALHQDKEENK